MYVCRFIMCTQKNEEKCSRTGRVLYLVSIYYKLCFVIMVVFVCQHFETTCCVHLHMNEGVSLMLNAVCEDKCVGV